MFLSYTCPNCDCKIRMKYLEIGEIAKCKSCGFESEVPEDAVKEYNAESNEQKISEDKEK